MKAVILLCLVITFQSALLAVVSIRLLRCDNERRDQAAISQTMRPCPTTHETVYQYGCGTR
jgi:hypothetical protein